MTTFIYENPHLTIGLCAGSLILLITLLEVIRMVKEFDKKL